MDNVFPKPNPYDSNPFVKWINKLLAGCKMALVQTSGDIKVQRTKDGTFLSLADEYKVTSRFRYDYEGLYKDKIRTTAELNAITDDHNYYNPSWGYKPGDIIRNKTSVGLGLDQVTNEPVSSSIGTFICVSTIPPSGSSNMTFDNSEKWTRQADIFYAPLDPEPYRLAHRNVFTETTPAAESYQTYQGRYWEKIGGSGGSYISMSVCIDGVTQTYMVDAYPVSVSA